MEMMRTKGQRATSSRFRAVQFSISMQQQKKSFKRIFMQNLLTFCWVENIKIPNWEANNTAAAS